MPKKLFTVSAYSPFMDFAGSHCVLAADKQEAIDRVFGGLSLTAEGDDHYLVRDPSGRFTRATITAYSDRGCACVLGSEAGGELGRVRPRRRRR